MQKQQSLSSWSSLYLWEWVCLQVETCLPNSVVDTDFQETAVWCPCLHSFLSFSSLLPTPRHLVRPPVALPNPWAPAPVLPLLKAFLHHFSPQGPSFLSATKIRLFLSAALILSHNHLLLYCLYCLVFVLSRGSSR